MEKGKWINDVMSSTAGMKKAEASPFLFEKIAARLGQEKQPENSAGLSFPRWAMAASFLVMINIFSVGYLLLKNKETKKEQAIKVLSAEMGYSTTYTY